MDLTSAMLPGTTSPLVPRKGRVFPGCLIRSSLARRSVVAGTTIQLSAARPERPDTDASVRMEHPRNPDRSFMTSRTSAIASVLLRQVRRWVVPEPVRRLDRGAGGRADHRRLRRRNLLPRQTRFPRPDGSFPRQDVRPSPLRAVATTSSRDHLAATAGRERNARACASSGRGDSGAHCARSSR